MRSSILLVDYPGPQYHASVFYQIQVCSYNTIILNGPGFKGAAGDDKWIKVYNTPSFDVQSRIQFVNDNWTKLFGFEFVHVCSASKEFLEGVKHRSICNTRILGLADPIRPTYESYHVDVFETVTFNNKQYNLCLRKIPRRTNRKYPFMWTNSSRVDPCPICLPQEKVICTSIASLLEHMEARHGGPKKKKEKKTCVVCWEQHKPHLYMSMCKVKNSHARFNYSRGTHNGCDECRVTCYTTKELIQHLRGKRHKLLVSRKKRYLRKIRNSVVLTEHWTVLRILFIGYYEESSNFGVLPREIFDIIFDLVIESSIYQRVKAQSCAIPLSGVVTYLY
mmetsp:Transcript_18919/g.21084  ORF Transcript_18919/g.21084 Transcript_18919/m.21084 type:complete len:335 (+) Transcript_18919:2-1006(+)